MKVEFDITMTAKAMRGYRFYHKYTRAGGIMELVLGLFLLCFCVITIIQKTNISYTLIVGFLGLFFLVIMPVSMALRAGKTVKTSKRFQEPTHYVVEDKGMTVSMQDMQAQVKWDEIYKIKETKNNIFIYFTPVSANVLPKEQLEGKLADLKALISKNMKPYTFKLK